MTAQPKQIEISLTTTGTYSDVDGWPVQITFPGGERSFNLHSPFTTNEEENLRWYLEDFALKDPFRSDRAAQAAASLAKYASELLQTIGIKDVIEKHLTLGTDVQFSVTGFEDDDSIQALHWEALQLSLQSDGGTFFVERLVNQATTPLLQGQGNSKNTLRVLFVTARAARSSQDDIDPFVTLNAITNSLSSRGSRRISLTILRPATLSALKKVLESEHYDIVHFDLHGAVKRSGAMLYFSNPDDVLNVTEVRASRVAKVLAKSGTANVVLNSCQSATHAKGATSNLAMVFLSQGISAVVGMSFKLLLSAAEIFVQRFYGALCDSNVTINEAVIHARHCLLQYRTRKARYRSQVSTVDFIVPVMYCSKLGVLAGEKRLAGLELHLPHGLTANDSGIIGSGRVVGRNFDVLGLESKLLLTSNVEEICGDNGIGKTAFVKYCAEWFQKTRLVDLVAQIDFLQFSYTTVTDLCHEISRQLSLGVENLGETVSSHFEQLPGINAGAETTKSTIKNNTQSKCEPVTSFTNAYRCLVVLDHFEHVQQRMSDDETQELKAFVNEVTDDSGQDISQTLFIVTYDRTQCSLGYPQYRLEPLPAQAAETLAMRVMSEQGLSIETDFESMSFFDCTMALLNGNPAVIEFMFKLSFTSSTSLAKRRYIAYILRSGIRSANVTDFPSIARVRDTLEDLYESLESPYERSILASMCLFQIAMPQKFIDYVSNFGNPLLPDGFARLVLDSTEPSGLLASQNFLLTFAAESSEKTKRILDLMESRSFLYKLHNEDTWNVRPIVSIALSMVLQTRHSGLWDSIAQSFFEFYRMEAIPVSKEFPLIGNFEQNLSALKSGLPGVTQIANYITAAALRTEGSSVDNDDCGFIYQKLLMSALVDSAARAFHYPIFTITEVHIQRLDKTISSRKPVGSFKRIFNSKRYKLEDARYKGVLGEAMGESLGLCEVYLEYGLDARLSSEIPKLADRLALFELSFRKDLNEPLTMGTVGNILQFQAFHMAKNGRFKDAIATAQRSIRIFNAIPAPYNVASHINMQRSVKFLAGLHSRDPGSVEKFFENMKNDSQKQGVSTEEIESAVSAMSRAFREADINDHRLIDTGAARRIHNSSELPHLSRTTEIHQAFMARLLSQATNSAPAQLSRENILSQYQQVLESDGGIEQMQLLYLLAETAQSEGYYQEAMGMWQRILSTQRRLQPTERHESKVARYLAQIGQCALGIEAVSVEERLKTALPALCEAYFMCQFYGSSGEQRFALVSILQGLDHALGEVEAHFSLSDSEDTQPIHIPWETKIRIWIELLAFANDPTIEQSILWNTVGPKMTEILQLAHNGDTMLQLCRGRLHDIIYCIDEQDPRLTRTSKAISSTLGININIVEHVLDHASNQHVSLVEAQGQAGWLSQRTQEELSTHQMNLQTLLSDPMLAAHREAEWVLFANRDKPRTLKHFDAHFGERVLRKKWDPELATQPLDFGQFGRFDESTRYEQTT